MRDIFFYFVKAEISKYLLMRQIFTTWWDEKSSHSLSILKNLDTMLPKQEVNMFVGNGLPMGYMSLKNFFLFLFF